MTVEVIEKARTRVLVVEDEALVAEWLRMLLDRLGYEIVGVCASAEEALSEAAASDPDLVLMDIQLRGRMDGIEAAARLRSEQEIAVVFITAYADSETIARVAETAPYGYLVKPFDERALSSTLETALVRSGLERQLREKERFHRATLMAIGDGVISADASGRVILMNPVAEALTAWSEEEARGEDVAQIARIEIPDPRREDPLQEALRLREGGHVLRRRDGRRVPVEIVTSRHVSGSVVVLRDLTERLGVEESLRRNERLSAMGLLLWGFAHEARNPLFGVSATLELFEEDVEPGSLHADYLSRLKSGVNRLEQLIQRVQEFAHSAPALPEPQAPRRLVDAAIASCGDAADRAGVSIACDLPADLPVIHGHESPLLQMFAALIQNAVQHSGTGSAVVVTGRLNDGRTRLAIEIEDSGPGVSDEQLERLFQPFYSEREGALGLGLTRALRIAEEHGGTIVAERRSEGGCRFTVSLPVSLEHSGSADA